MAVSITRTAMTDDDGSGQTGTVINNAWKTELYDQVDAVSAALLPLAGGTMVGDLKFTDATYDIGKTGATRPRDGFFSRNVVIGGTLTVTGAPAFGGILSVTGFGTHSFSAGGSGNNVFSISNTSAGTTNGARLSISNDVNSLNITARSSTYTTSAGFDVQSGVDVLWAGAGGLGIYCSGGDIRFAAGGTTVTAKNKASDGKWYTNDGTVSSLSDERTKERVGDFVAGLDAIRGIVTGNLGAWQYKTGDVLINGRLVDYPRARHSFIGAGAQTIQRYIPEAVSTDEQGVLTVTTTPVFWAGMRAIVEIADRVSALEARFVLPDGGKQRGGVAI